MRRLVRGLLVASTLVGTLAFTALVAPGQALACSCVQRDENQIFTGSEDVVVMGTVGPDQGNGVYAFAVERWFHGGEDTVIPVVSGVVRFPGGGQSMNTCGIELLPGQRWIFAAFKGDGGYTPNVCAANARLETEYAQRVMAAAVAIFGPAKVPAQPSAPPAPVDAPQAGYRSDIGQVAMFVALPFVAFVLLVLVIGWFRRRSEGSEAS